MPIQKTHSKKKPLASRTTSGYFTTASVPQKVTTKATSTDAGSTSSGTVLVSGTSATSSWASGIQSNSVGIRPMLLVDDSVAMEAILNHLKFLRSAGRVVVSIADVATKLDLPPEQVKRLAQKVGAILE